MQPKYLVKQQFEFFSVALPFDITHYNMMLVIYTLTLVLSDVLMVCNFVPGCISYADCNIML